MDQDFFAFLDELQRVYSHISVSDVLSILPILIPLLVVASWPVIWALKKGYGKATARFEEANPHMVGKYFSFAEWVYLKDSDAFISNKAYKKKFGDVPVTNTDSILDMLRQIEPTADHFRKTVSMPVRIAVIALGAFMLAGIVFGL